MNDVHTFEQPLNYDITFNIASKILKPEGNIVWEYNPFRNYRITEPTFYFRNKYLKVSELQEELGITLSDETFEQFLQDQTDWDFAREGSSLVEHVTSVENPIKSTEDDPIFYDSGQLIDFDTDELSFDLNHPVEILPQYSYDGSVNLIINDGINKPRLINSRFSSIGRNKYQIADRSGDNDTNIYDQGFQFDTDTSLYKTYNGIPQITLLGINSGGRLPVGNYHFYFCYADADGNETDIVGESGLVSIFIGEGPFGVNGGNRNQSTDKAVRFVIDDIDTGYSSLLVYYSKSTSDLDQNSTTSYYKIQQQYTVSDSGTCNLMITGLEDIQEISVEEINMRYSIAENVVTSAVCQNMLFLGNIHKESIPYNELKDLSLRFCPYVSTEQYKGMDANYTTTYKQTYYDPEFIYNYTGYQKNELYRFGIVYVMNSGSLSPVFNIRGGNGSGEYMEFPVYSNNARNYITYNEETGILYQEISSDSEDSENQQNSNYSTTLENAFGVFKIHASDSELNHIFGIQIKVQESDYVFEILRRYNIKGYFFVRQKRIPLRICQVYTLGIDNQSHIPMPLISSGEEEKYLVERFMDDDRILTQDFSSRLLTGDFASHIGGICPDYDLNQSYYNSIFNGSEYYLQTASTRQPLSQDSANPRHYYTDLQEIGDGEVVQSTVVGIEDGVKLIETNSKLFSARAGEAEEAFRYEYAFSERVETKSSNLVRGLYGPYLGFGSVKEAGYLYNIYAKEAFDLSEIELYKLRYQDKSPYYAISPRYNIEKEFSDPILYRGDSYICTFTHRLNRNFSDPSSPTNDKIVDEKCWKDHYKVEDGVVKTENFEEINLGDVNAVKLGIWITFPVVSSVNLNIRSVDDTIPDEMALYGHPRTFYPYTEMLADGTYKIPEALTSNQGFKTSLSSRYNLQLPDVPYIKDEYSNRIQYSDIHVNDAFTNGFRVFRETHYRDYPKTYGSITRLVEWGGNLVCVFEHGVALIPVNERAVAGEGSGGNVYINTSNVLPENPKIISHLFGSQWRESIVKTPLGIYGVDTVGKKIWRTNGETFECISDFRVQEFLNQNISLTERELDPVIGIRNVKTHYNAFKQDVMFTFYDNLHGFEEKVWNLCWSEPLQKFTTFYSWIPSYSENIDNQYFSFDRNTSKWIAKLGISKADNDFADGVTVDNNIITDSNLWKTELSLSNRQLPDNVDYQVKYTLERDNYGNYKMFDITEEEDTDGKIHSYLVFKTSDYVEDPEEKSYTYDSICSELYAKSLTIDGKTQIIYPGNKELYNRDLPIYTDDSGRRIWLNVDDEDPQKRPVNSDKIVILLNLKAHLVIKVNETADIKEAYINGITNQQLIDAGYYESVVALIPKYNIQFLTTDFWKHGQAGIIDIADKIYPTYWYGKQHPFEFEFIVADNPDKHKIFDNLEIISNNAEPESFHYEIVGDCYNFAKDKKNMYIRQEATKELYQYNGSDVTYDHEYSDLDSEHRPLLDSDGNEIPGFYDRSTLMPLYYSRQDTINEIEDSYHLKDDIPTKDFSALAGGEIVHYKTLDEYRIWNHAKAVDMQTKGRLRGNMQYNEDKWLVQINPINIVYKNESKWVDLEGKETSKIPVELGQSPIPKDVLVDDNGNPKKNIEIPQDFTKDGRGYVTWKWSESQRKEVKLKDKWIKIRIRYSGKKLAVITAIKTLYSVSYS